MKELFGKHLQSRLDSLFQIMDSEKIECLVIHSGNLNYHYLDDQPKTFRTNPHFAYICPATGEGHVLKLQPGSKPQLYYYSPDDFWHETSELKGFFWQDFFDIQVYKDYDKDLNLGSFPIANTVGISPNAKFYEDFSLTEPSANLLSQIHWLRTSKTDYEIACMDRANALGAKAHLAAKDAFFAGKSEYGILLAYLGACEQREDQLPYNSIIALNQHSAVLHYQVTRHEGNGQTFLIDAGARHNFYNSDITRSYFQPNVHPVFQEIHMQLNKVQQQLCTMVTPGRDYKEIQHKARTSITGILCETGVFTCPFDQAMEKNLSYAFFPHGVGHGLGLQVHDVAGKQTGTEGTPATTVKNDPYLRLLRTIQNNDALTIEPGIYFIPMLLNQLKGESSSNKLMDWKLIDALIPLGGIRIEDNVIASLSGPLNLTRKYLTQ